MLLSCRIEYNIEVEMRRTPKSTQIRVLMKMNLLILNSRIYLYHLKLLLILLIL